MKKQILMFSFLCCILSTWGQTSEYCEYVYAPKDNQPATTWVTDGDGNVVVTISDSPYATNAVFRNGGFEGKMDGFSVLSGDGFATSEAADTYFTREGGETGTTVFKLLKKSDVTLPSPCKIRFSTKSFSWKCDEKPTAYKSNVYEYTYGTACPSMDAPTNVSVSDDGVVTFIAVEGATKYLANVYFGSILKYSQVITNGGTLTFKAYVAGDYDVKIIASGPGMAPSEESDAAVWHMAASPMPGSEYCGVDFSSGNTACKFAWVTLSNGNIEVTLTEPDGSVSTEKDHLTTFRSNGIDLNNLKVDGVDASTYFTSSYSSNVQTFAIKDQENKPALGSKITYAKYKVTYKVYSNQDAWPSLEFNYTYGTKCATLDTPTNVAITEEGVVTFDLVENAESYLVRVYDGDVLKMEKTISSGNQVEMYSFVNKTFQVCVVAVNGTARSDESEKQNWTLKSAYLSQPSEYCEALMVKGGNSAVFDWQTNENGDVVITISESDDGEPGSTHFRAEAMSNEDLNQFKVNDEDAANYFTRQYTTDDAVYTLKLKDGVSLAPGATIVHTGYARYVSKKDGANAYKDFGFTYTYGTRCVGYQVSAEVNDPAMGTAVVKQNGEEVTVVEGGIVQYIATANDTYEFVNWTQNGVEVSTDATYETEITATTRLVANFDYIRETYCHEAITSTSGGNKKLYMTLSQVVDSFQIVFEGSSECQLTSLKSANFTINGVCTNIEYGDIKTCGNDVVFSKDNGRVRFFDKGYGSAIVTFALAENTSWKDIHAHIHTIYFNTASGEVGYTGFPDRYRINWPNTCEDATAPVLTKYQVDVLDAHSVRFTLSATDELDKLIYYTISRENAEDVVLTGANGVDVFTEITGLTPNTEYTFSIKASDGTNESDPIEVKVTPAGDVEAPTNVQLILKPLSLTDAKLTVSADDNYPGDLTYTITSGTLAESLVLQGAPSTPIVQMLTGLTAGETYTYSVIVTDAAGNHSKPVVATLTMFSENILLNKPATAGSTETGKDAPRAVDGYVATFWGNFNRTTYAAHDNWLAVNCNGIYDVSSVTITWSHFPTKAGFVLQKRLGAEEWQTIYTYTGDKYGENATQLIEFAEPIRMSDIRIINEDATEGKTYYMAINELAAFGEKVEDTEAPQSLSLSGEAISEESIRLTMYATDNSYGYLTYTVYVDNVAQTTTMVAPQATDAVYVLESLNPGQTYEIYFTVADASGNSSTSTTISVTTMDVSGNVAYRRLAIAGSEEDAHRAVAAVDGDNSTYWGNYNKPSAEEQNNWLEVDLCGSYVVDRVSITWQHCPNDGFVLQARDGEGEWQTILNYSGTAYSDNQTQIIDLDQPTYSAFRVMKENTSYMAIREFKAFGEGHVQIKDNANNDVHITALSGQTLDVELDRTFIADGANYTLCLPFDMTEEQCVAAFGEGYKLWELGEAYMKTTDMMYLPFSEVRAIEAGKPYLFCPTVNIENPIIEGVTINAAAPVAYPVVQGGALATMTGIYSPAVVAASNYVLGGDNWLYQSDGGQMYGLRCYFTFGSGVQQNVRARAVFHNTDVTTDLEPIHRFTDSPIKVIKDGHLYIIRNNARYNGMGQQVK